MAAEAIDAKIKGLGDWRGDTLAKLRALIRAADPEVEETVKWQKPSNPAGVPVWDHAGILCTGETYKDKVKLTFTKGARSEEHTSELQSLMRLSYAVVCLKKNKYTATSRTTPPR